MDANALKSSDDFGKLRDTHVIFITENDVMGDGQDSYSYLRMEERSSKRLCDGTHIIYVNGATRSATGIGKLVHDLLCRDAADMHFDVLKKRVGDFKKTEEGRRTMCETMERFRAEGKAEGIVEGEARGKARGKRETMLAMAKRMLKDGVLALKDIARYSGLSVAAPLAFYALFAHCARMMPRLRIPTVLRARHPVASVPRRWTSASSLPHVSSRPRRDLRRVRPISPPSGRCANCDGCQTV